MVTAAALIFGLLPHDSKYLDCGSILFKGGDVYPCTERGDYPMTAGLLVTIILVATAVWIYATVARNNAGSDTTPRPPGNQPM